jgi:RNA polymerase sigma-70 factor (ECF subfamily)
VGVRLPWLSSDEEAEILAGVRAGGDARRVASGRLRRDLREPLHALCFHLTGSRSGAEEAVSEALVAAYRGLPSFPGGLRLTTWLYRIALRASLRVGARRLDAGRLEAETPGGGGHAGAAVRDEARRAAAAMARLPAEHRAVLSLFAVEGLPHAEIAGILGIPERMIWLRLHAARLRLVESQSI